MLVKSPYTHLFSNNSKYYIYNSQSEFFSEISKEFYGVLKDRNWEQLPKDVLDKLSEKKVLIDSAELSTFFYDTRVRYLTNAYHSDTIGCVIVPTTSCNFECPYCFEPKKSPKSITPEVEDKIIDYLKNQQEKNLSLTWYGGEPLLMLAKIKRLYHKIIKESGKTIVNHTIITNGYLLNDSAIKFINDSKINHIQITLDGVEANHNKTRYLKAGKKPTFSKIQQNIEKLAKKIPALNISLRVNINKSNYNDFVEIYKHYSQHEWQKNINVYPGVIREDTPDKCSLCHQSYTNSELLDLYEYFCQEGVEINFKPRRANKGCMIQRCQSFIIGPEGELYKCWNDVSDPSKVIGSIMDDEKRNYAVLMSYMNELDPFDEECKKCSVFPICDGGCGNLRYRNLHEGGCFEYCSPYKNPKNLEKALLLAIEHSPKNGKGLKL